MKTTLLTAALLIAGCAVFAQENIVQSVLVKQKTETESERVYNMIKNEAKLRLEEYCNSLDCNENYRAADDINFQKQINTIFSTVVLNNSDVVNSGSAFGYSLDEDNHKFSANMAFLSQNNNRLMFDMGTSITNINDNYSYYSNGAWANDIALRVGVNYRLSSRQYVTAKKCNEAKAGRDLYMFNKLNEIKEAVKLNKSEGELKIIKELLIDEGLSLNDAKTKYSMQKEKLIEEILEACGAKQNEEKLDRDKLDEYLKNYTELNDKHARDYNKELEKLSKRIEIIRKIEFILDSSQKTEENIYCAQVEDKDKEIVDEKPATLDSRKLEISKIENYIDEIISEYDEKNNIFHGYQVHWVGFKGGISTNTFKISNDSIMMASIQEKFPNLMKLSFESSYNLSHSGIRTIQFFKLYGNLNRGSFLDAPNLKNENIAVNLNDADANDVYYDLIDSNGNVIQRYSHVRDPKWNMDVGAYYSNFYFFDKTLGLVGRANFNFPVGKGLEMNYKPNYTLLAGLAFRVAGAEKWSSATFTINTGFENVFYDVNAFDSFIVKASVGVPFSIFQKKS